MDMKRFLTAFAVATIAILSCKKKDHTPPPTAPVVSTAQLTNVNISAGTATAGGSITSDGGAAITKSGIVWSKINNTPTITDSMVAGTTATGTFTSNRTGLDFGNTYYFRAFATNSVGTGYGSVVTLTTSSDSVKFTYNGQTVTYGIITSPTTGKKWLDRNLGAKRQATAYNDFQAYGDFFQWGRPADGHQLMNWTSSTTGTPVNGTTAIKATSDIPGHNNFIILADPFPLPYDWRDDDNKNRWVTNPQGPCPAGWHVPTVVEWRAEGAEVASGGTAGGISDRNSAYSKLKLSVAGFRDYDGQIFVGTGSGPSPGNTGRYWTSSIPGSGSDATPAQFAFTNTAAGIVDGDFKVNGLSVRCIKD
jgi:uncharacterized protein (TIGR02145 family)